MASQALRARPNGLSASRIVLAGVFVIVDGSVARLGIVGAAGATGFRRLVACGALAAAVLAAGARPLQAQVWTPAEPPRDTSVLRPELRLDWFGGRAGALHAGAGISARAGNYLRVGVNGGAGLALDEATHNVAHADVTARFMLDPFRQQRVGISLGGGVGARHQHDRIRAFALLFVDAEAGRSDGWMPFVRAGIGGGVRVTAGFRRAGTRFR